MKKLLVALGICGVLIGSGYAEAAVNQLQTSTVDTGRTKGKKARWFEDYVTNEITETFAGSSTAGGGPTEFGSGTVNVEMFAGPKDFAIYMTPVSTGGSVTVTMYGVFGTTTTESGTSGAAIIARVVLASTTATSTAVRVDSNPSLVAMSTQVTNGSVTVTGSMNVIEPH